MRVSVFVLGALACGGSPTNSTPEPGAPAKPHTAPPEAVNRPDISSGVSAVLGGRRNALVLGRDGQLWSGTGDGWLKEATVEIGRGFRDDTRILLRDGDWSVLHSDGVSADQRVLKFPDDFHGTAFAFERYFVAADVKSTCDGSAWWTAVDQLQWRPIPSVPVAYPTLVASSGKLYAFGEDCTDDGAETGRVFSLEWPPSDQADWKPEQDIAAPEGWRGAAAVTDGVALVGLQREGGSLPAVIWRRDGEVASLSTPEEVKTAVRPSVLALGDEVFVATPTSGTFAWNPAEDTWRAVSAWSCPGPMLFQLGDSLWAAGWTCPPELIADLSKANPE